MSRSGRPSPEELLEESKNRTIKGRDSREKMKRTITQSLDEDEDDSRKPFLEEQPEVVNYKKIQVPQPQSSHYGLYNQGATCYLNSILQVLHSTTEFRERLEPKDQELKDIFDKLEYQTCKTENLTRSLEIPNVNRQGDAPECLEMILHKVSPKATEVFEGKLRHTTNCSQGHCIIEETNTFWTLSLSLKGGHGTPSVEGGIERLLQTKSFSGDNKAHCNTCKMKTEATAKCEMVKFPQILALILSRFEFDYNTMSYVKSDCSVNVPFTLKIEKKMYSLYGMVNHTGGMGGGHYTATILSKKDQTWNKFNDGQVGKVEKQPFAEGNTYCSQDVYLLVYRALVKEKQVEDKQEHKVEPKGTCRDSDADDEDNRSKNNVEEENNREPLLNQNPSLTSQDPNIQVENKQRSETKNGAKSPEPCESQPDENNTAINWCSDVFCRCVCFRNFHSTAGEE